MTAPATITVTGTYLNADGSVSVQKVTFTPLTARFVNNDNIISNSSVTATPNGSGLISQVLVSCAGGYTVVETGITGATHTYTIVGTANLDLGTLSV